MNPVTSLCCLRVAIDTVRCTRIKPPTATATNTQTRNTPKGTLKEGRLSGNGISQGRSRYYLSGRGANLLRRHQASGTRGFPLSRERRVGDDLGLPACGCVQADLV